MPTKTKKNVKSRDQLVNKLAKKPLSVPTVIGVLVLAVAIGGYLIYKSFASSMTYFGTHNGVSVYACKTYSGAFGGVYKTQIRFVKAPTTGNYYYKVEVWRPNHVADSTANRVAVAGGNSYWNGVIAQEDEYASIPLKDFLVATVYDSSSSNSSGQGYPVGPYIFVGPDTPWSKVANC